MVARIQLCKIDTKTKKLDLPCLEFDTSQMTCPAPYCSRCAGRVDFHHLHLTAVAVMGEYKNDLPLLANQLILFLL